MGWQDMICSTDTDEEIKIGSKIWVRKVSRDEWYPAILINAYDVKGVMSYIIHFRVVRICDVVYYGDDLNNGKDHYYEEECLVIKSRDT